MRDTSLACLLDFGLKSQSRATRSHSVPGLLSSRSEIMASSAALHATERTREKRQSVDEKAEQVMRGQPGDSPLLNTSQNLVTLKLQNLIERIYECPICLMLLFGFSRVDLRVETSNNETQKVTSA